LIGVACYRVAWLVGRVNARRRPDTRLSEKLMGIAQHNQHGARLGAGTTGLLAC